MKYTDGDFERLELVINALGSEGDKVKTILALYGVDIITGFGVLMNQMPKLRGLDPTEAAQQWSFLTTVFVTKLQTILNDIKRDDPLIDAIIYTLMFDNDKDANIAKNAVVEILNKFNTEKEKATNTLGVKASERH